MLQVTRLCVVDMDADGTLPIQYLEIPKKNLKIGVKIGEGRFGEVYKGEKKRWNIQLLFKSVFQVK